MSAVSFCMDLILASLLLAALLVGVRLEKRLKALRESQAGFAGAVLELDAAIARAEKGLAELKSAALESQTTIADRVQDAKGMAARLDKHTQAGGEAAERLEALLERYGKEREFVERRAAIAPRPWSASATGERDRVQRSGGGAVVARPAPAAPSPVRPTEAPDAAPFRRAALSRSAAEEPLELTTRLPAAPSRRPAADDELFELIEPALRAARGMAR